MSIRISQVENMDLKPKITVIGVGGAGGNAVNNMISANLGGVDFWVANTDAQAMEYSLTNNRLQLGVKTTLGLGAGSHPEVGKQAAEESANELSNLLNDVNMLFITAGMGGGTGTGGAPVIAKLAREKNILTVAIVTMPFHFEGSRRMKMAELGLEELNKCVDTLIVIPNQNLFRVVNEHTTFADSFKRADDVLGCGVRGITDLITMPGIINLDFADIRSVMSEMGKAMMGTGEAEGENRAVMAAEAAISNPLIDNSSMKGARALLINITGGDDMTLFQVDAAANRIREEVDPNANIIFGSAYNSELTGKIRVSVVATGIDGRGANASGHTAGNLRAAPSISSDPVTHSATTAANSETAFDSSMSFAGLNSPSMRTSEIFSAPTFEMSLQSGFNDENDQQDSDEDTSNDSDDSFIPPKAAEFNGFASYTDQHSNEAVANDSVSSNTPQHPAAQFGQPPQAVNMQESAAAAAPVAAPQRKKMEDFFDIPAYIRKKIKF